MKISKVLGVLAISLSFVACSTNTSTTEEQKMGPQGRAEYEFEKLKDPATGEIPENMRMRELEFATSLPKSYTKNARTSAQIFEPIGPRNVGGRTRAISYDVDSSNIVLAGGISGGMWRSVDNGVSWKRATNFEDHSAVSCMIQDKRSGKTNTFYYGAGESIGNSASKSFSANYYGNGIFKSVDHGATWTHIASTAALVQKSSDWAIVFNIALDQSRNDSDIIYAATLKGIRRSNDGGNTWNLVLGGSTSADYTEIVTTTTGVAYATISADGSSPGFWRSEDGLTWTKISPLDLAVNHDKTKMAIAPSNENVVYFYSSTPNVGLSDVSFWKYNYVSGNGSGAGGVWDNRSSNLPSSTGYDLNTQGSYCMSLAVKPDNENMVFLGATNLFRSNTGFASNNQTRQLGGYDADGYSNFNIYEDNQHPDQQSLAFSPHNPNHLLAGTDGGLHFTTNPTSSKVLWASYNNGYQTTQFYGMGIDHLLETEVVVSGYQDNGSWWTNSANINAIWKYTMGGDGSYCAKEGGQDNYYFSSQNGYIRRVKLSSTGSVISRKDARPSGATNSYLFNHPFILDPADNNKMYLPNGNDLWRNSNLAGIDNNQNNWTKISTSTVSNDITALAASLSSPGTVYIGHSNRKIYKVEDDGSSSATLTDITTGITSGTYTSNIAIDPYDADKVIAVYSNYNVISIWYTEDAGANWKNIEGNLKGDSDPGVPPNLSHIGNGPSFRWARFIPTDFGNAILVGTSIGLFATNDLDVDTVQWVQQASDVIGNVVIEQIDHRISDGFCVVSTHGAGAYKTYFENSWDIISVENVETNALKINIYPNPAQNQVRVDFSVEGSESVRADLRSVTGQMLFTEFVSANAGSNTFQFDISSLPKGTYFITLNSDKGTFTKSLVKN